MGGGGWVEVSQETGSAADSRAKVGFDPVGGQRHDTPQHIIIIIIILATP